VRRLPSGLRRPGTTAVAAVLVLAGLGVTADLTAPAAVVGPATSPAARPEVAVAQADGVCPDPAADARTQTRVSVAAPGGGDENPGRGRAHLAQLDGDSVPLDVSVPASGSVLAATDAGPLVARAEGAAAPGLAVGMLTRSTVDSGRGLLGTTCVTAGSDWWFVGSGSVVGQRGRVYLSNPEAAPAVLDLTLYGQDGPIDAPAGRGIAVAAGAQEVPLLDALAPGISVFAIHVHARTGRIAAAVRDQQIDGLTPRGADWLPAAAPPARRQLVAGVVSGTGERVLQVVAPGESDAIVKVRLVTETGSFAPSGLDVLEVKAGSVAVVDLAPYAGTDPVAVSLDSDVPVTAGVLARATGTATGALTDVAYTAAGRPLTPETPGAVPEARTGTGIGSTMLLATSGAAATVRVAPLPPATGTPQEVEVPAESQVVLDLATVSTAPSFSVSVVPLRGSGPVYAVREVTEAEAKGPMVTTEPVPPGRYTVAVPPVLADLSTGLRTR
jgi:hypothetical protein